MKKLALILVLLLSVSILGGCNAKNDLKASIDNLNEVDNYYYELNVNLQTDSGVYTKSDARMTYYPATGELSSELSYESSMQSPYTASVYGVLENGEYWNYVGVYDDAGSRYQKSKLSVVPNVYHVNNFFDAVYKNGTNYAKGNRKEISGNICQQYVVSIPKEASLEVLNSFGAIGDFQAMGADVAKIQEVVSQNGIQVEIWLDTVDKIPVCYRVDNTSLLKLIFTEMGMSERAESIETCETEMNVYGVNLTQEGVKVPARMKNEAVDISAQ